MATVHCKKCDNKEFATLSELRKHQWAVHKESYANLVSAAKNSAYKKGITWSKKQRKKYKTTMALRKAQEIPNGTQMSALQLLDKLRQQKNFMVDVVSLVERMIQA